MQTRFRSLGQGLSFCIPAKLSGDRGDADAGGSQITLLVTRDEKRIEKRQEREAEEKRRMGNKEEGKGERLL